MSKNLSFEFLASQKWALEGNFLQRMSKVAMREEISPSALEAHSGKQSGPITTIRGSVAVINIQGVVSRYANIFHNICGGVSTELLAKEFTAALDNPQIKGIVLNIDSPGGEASGIHELSEMIYQGRQTKPVKAYVGGLGCSAAYWIASACDSVTIDATASVGSIGVVCSVVKQDDPEGQTSYEFVSSQSPNKRLDIASDEGQSAMQNQLDHLANVFIERVARNMNVSKHVVEQQFGKGGTMIGADAVSSKMAHTLGSLEGVIESIQGKLKPRVRAVSGAKLSQDNFDNVFSGLKANSATEAADVIKLSLPDVAKLINQDANVTHENIGIEAALDLADSAGYPRLAKSLSKMTSSKANWFIEQANGIKDKLAAADMDIDIEPLILDIENPSALLGKAIYSIQSIQDEEREIFRGISEPEEKQQQAYDPKAIYQARQNYKG
jgi:capsid assembly protease